jgi:hypothetical protein
MLSIRMREPGSDEFMIVQAEPDRYWPAKVKNSTRDRLKQTSDVQSLFSSGRWLAVEIAPLGLAGNRDLDRLQNCLRAESLLDTNDPATLWELMAWGDLGAPHFWGIEQPVVRVYRPDTQAGPIFNPSANWQLRGRLVVASDPGGDLRLRSEPTSQHIRRLASDSCNKILWDPAYDKVIQEIATGTYGLLIFIGHASYDADQPNQSKHYLNDGEYLTPHDLREHLNGQPVVVFIACGGAQHAPPHGGPAATQAMGFMPACLDQGAAAFIGPLWEIKVDGGLWLAEHLLKHLKTNPPGEALRLTRQEALVRTLEDRTWAPNRTWAPFVAYQVSQLPPAVSCEADDKIAKAPFVAYQVPQLPPKVPPEPIRWLMKWIRWPRSVLVTPLLLLLIVIATLSIPGLRTKLAQTQPTPTLSLEALTFTITCSDGQPHTIQAGQTITLAAIRAVFVELPIAPQDWDALVGTLRKLPGEEKKFAYYSAGSGLDVLTFTFIADEESGRVATKALLITIVPEGRDLCNP